MIIRVKTKVALVNEVRYQNRFAAANHTKTTRARAKQSAREQLGAENLEEGSLPKPVVAVYLHLYHKRLPDVAACGHTAKAALDGIVDAGYLPKDSPEYVASATFLTPVRVQENEEGLIVGLGEYLEQTILQVCNYAETVLSEDGILMKSSYKNKKKK